MIRTLQPIAPYLALTCVIFVSGESFAAAPTTDDNCGLASVYIAVGAMANCKESFSDFVASAGPIGENGASVTELEKIVSDHGLFASAIETRQLSAVERLIEGRLVIAHMSRGHYVTISDIDAIKVTYFDRGVVYQALRTKFEPELSGAMLVVDDEPIELPANRGWILGGCLGVLVAGIGMIIYFRSQ